MTIFNKEEYGDKVRVFYYYATEEGHDKYIVAIHNQGAKYDNRTYDFEEATQAVTIKVADGLISDGKCDPYVIPAPSPCGKFAVKFEIGEKVKFAVQGRAILVCTFWKEKE